MARLEQSAQRANGYRGSDPVRRTQHYEDEEEDCRQEAHPADEEASPASPAPEVDFVSFVKVNELCEDNFSLTPNVFAFGCKEKLNGEFDHQAYHHHAKDLFRQKEKQYFEQLSLRFYSHLRIPKQEQPPNPSIVFIHPFRFEEFRAVLLQMKELARESKRVSENALSLLDCKLRELDALWNDIQGILRNEQQYQQLPKLSPPSAKVISPETSSTSILRVQYAFPKQQQQHQLLSLYRPSTIQHDGSRRASPRLLRPPAPKSNDPQDNDDPSSSNKGKVSSASPLRRRQSQLSREVASTQEGVAAIVPVRGSSSARNIKARIPPIKVKKVSSYALSTSERSSSPRLDQNAAIKAKTDETHFRDFHQDQQQQTLPRHLGGGIGRQHPNLRRIP